MNRYFDETQTPIMVAMVTWLALDGHRIKHDS